MLLIIYFYSIMMLYIYWRYIMINANHNVQLWLRLYHTSMHYDLYSNHNALYYYVFSLFGLVAKYII